jgi:hypothetical protein
LTEPKPTILVGWDFGLNPWQFATKTVTNIATNEYTADQTILIQQNYVSSATGNNVAVGQGSLANNYGYEVKAVTAHNQFGILQYIAPESARPYWGKTVSAMVTAFLNTSHSTVVKVKMRLLYIAALPSAVSQTYPVATWTEGSDPVFAAGVTAITPPNDPVYTLSSADQQFAFNGIVLPTSTNANMTLGVMVYSVGNMNEAATADFIIIKDVSLVHNDFALASNPKTSDQVLRECEFYYEQSYQNFSDVATATFNGSRMYPLQIHTVGGNDFVYYQGFELLYRTIKNGKGATLTPAFYSPITGSASNIDIGVQNHANPPSATYFGTVGQSNWSIGSQSTKNIIMFQASDGGANGGIATQVYNQGAMYFQYVADARL